MSKHVPDATAEGCGCEPADGRKRTCALSKETITLIDNTLARFYLAAELLQIPEFRQVWTPAYLAHERLVSAVKPRLEAVGAGLSPEGRGALLLGEPSHGLYDDEALQEAERAAAAIMTIEAELRSGEYRSRLGALMEPLGVPGMVEVMEVLGDVKGWGLHRTLAGPVAGPASDLLEAAIIRGLTDLSPAEAMSETRGQIGRRIERKVSTLASHHKRYDLPGRVRLWVRNVVYGEPIESIADGLQREEAGNMSAEPGEWVRQQVREAGEILGARRGGGRPRKGGVLRHWKLMGK